MQKLKVVSFKVTEEEYDEMVRIADKHYNGNLSDSVRKLYKSGVEDLNLVDRIGLLALYKLCVKLNPVYQLRLLGRQPQTHR